MGSSYGHQQGVAAFNQAMKKVGLIINPVAGMGGKVGLKGTDGPEIAEKARLLGAIPEAGAKTSRALRELKPLSGQIEFLTCPGPMGEETLQRCGLSYRVIDTGSRSPGEGFTQTGAKDTEAAARAMVLAGVDLLLFAGGDGTARDIYNALGPGSDQAVIGIPAGVKIHSAVYAVNPRSAGQLARQFLQKGGLPLRRAEVMDIDEEAFRAGHLSASLYGYLSVPCAGGLMQHLKIGGVETEMSVLEAIAEQIVGDMDDETVYIIGPGSTTGPIMHKLGLENTLLGVDLVEKGKLIVADASEIDILLHIEGRKAKIIVTVIGGQGYIFGRGNQQISAAVIRQVGRENIIVIAVREKILALDQPRLLVDTGDDAVNSMLSGYIKIVTGYSEELIYPVAT